MPSGENGPPSSDARSNSGNVPASKFLGEDESRALGPEMARLRVSGGAVYDALVGAAARQHRQQLVSADGQAPHVYEALGVERDVIGT